MELNGKKYKLIHPSPTTPCFICALQDYCIEQKFTEIEECLAYQEYPNEEGYYEEVKEN